MKILIDADGCPVVDITVKIAKSYDLEVIIVKTSPMNCGMIMPPL